MSKLSEAAFKYNQYKGSIAFAKKALSVLPPYINAVTRHQLQLVQTHLNYLLREIDISYEEFKFKYEQDKEDTNVDNR